MYDFSQFKARCSAISKVLSNSQSNPCLTEKQGKELDELEKKELLTEKNKERIAELLVKKENGNKVVLSDTCIDYLMEVYAWKTEGMIAVTKESMDVLQLKKGKMQEKDSIALLSFVKNCLYEKNEVQVFNEYLTGEPDVFAGTEIMQATIIEDTKTVWDYPTFLRCLHKPIERANREQISGYCDITGAKEGYVSKCLVSASIEIIDEIKWKVAKKFNSISIESPDFLKEWEKWEHSMVFDKIPAHKRVCSRPVELWSTFEQQAVYDRVKICRDWLCRFHEEYSKLNTYTT